MFDETGVAGFPPYPRSERVISELILLIICNVLTENIKVNTTAVSFPSPAKPPPPTIISGVLVSLYAFHLILFNSLCYVIYHH